MHLSNNVSIFHNIIRIFFIAASENLAGNYKEAMAKAKEAYNKEKTLKRLREQANLADSINVDLSYCVAFNLANQL